MLLDTGVETVTGETGVELATEELETGETGTVKQTVVETVLVVMKVLVEVVPLVVTTDVAGQVVV